MFVSSACQSGLGCALADWVSVHDWSGGSSGKAYVFAPDFIAIGPSGMGANAISKGPEFAPVSDAPSCRQNLLMAWRQEVAGRLRSCRPPSSCEAVALSQAPFLPLAAVLGAAGLASALGTAAALGAAGFVSAGLGAAALGASAGWTAAGLTGAALAAGAA